MKCKTKLITLSFVGLLRIVSAQTSPPTISVPRGALLALATVHPLDSGTAELADDVPLRLAHPFVLGGITVLPEGTEEHGKVTRVRRAGRQEAARCGDGWMDIDVKRIVFPDGSTALAEKILGPLADLGSLPASVASERIDRGLLAHPKDFVASITSSNLGPAIPVIFAIYGVSRITTPVVDLVTIPQKKRPCKTLVHDWAIPPGAIFGVAIAKDLVIQH